MILLKKGKYFMSKSKEVKLRNEKYYKELAHNIAYYRKHKGITQNELSETINISRSHLSAIESPNIIRPFSLEILFNISRALNVTPNKLIDKES